jgi:hypothetical protein
MTKRLLALSFLLSLAALPAAAQAPAPAGWVKFSPPGAAFSVLLPAQPKEDTQTSQSPQGPYTTHLFTSKSADREIYLVGWVDYAPSFNFGIQAELEANRDNFIKNVKGSKLLGTTPIKLGAHPGIEFKAELPGQADIISRVYIVGRRPYQIIALTPAGSGTTPGVERFFSSFQVPAAK